jgi:hypothetical protein
MLENSTIGGRVESLVFTIIIMDIVKGGRVNEYEVASDMLEIVKDVIAQLQHPNYEWEFDSQSVSIEPFTERFTDSVTGYSFKVTLLFPFAFDRCVMPYTPTSIPDIGCPVVTIYDSIGAVVTTVSAGGTYTLSASGGCSGTYNINVNGVLNQSGSSSDFSIETFNISA